MTFWKSALAAGDCKTAADLRKGPSLPGGPDGNVTLGPRLLARYPEGYRHLAYVQTKRGFKVKTNLPGLRGSAVMKLYADSRAWLEGS
jgi:hypothetical protein